MNLYLKDGEEKRETAYDLKHTTLSVREPTYSFIAHPACALQIRDYSISRYSPSSKARLFACGYTKE